MAVIAESKNQPISAVFVGQESDIMFSEAEQQACVNRDEREDVLACAIPGHEKRNDELHQHAHDDGVPVHCFAVARGRPKTGHEEGSTRQADLTVCASVVGTLLTDENADQDHRNHQSPAGGQS